MSMTVENVNNAKLVLGYAVHDTDLLTFAGAGTEPVGTILARSTASAKLIPFVKGGSSDGNGIPVAVLAAATTAAGAGDEPVNPLISGQVRTDLLIIKADGDASNVDKVVLDQLRTMTIIGLSTSDLSVLDNQ